MPRAKNFLKFWLPAILWMLVILTGSTDLLSAQHTSRFLAPAIRWLWPRLADNQVLRIVFVIRKTGHLLEYAVLGVLLLRARRYSIVNEPRSSRREEALTFKSEIRNPKSEMGQSLVTSSASEKSMAITNHGRVSSEPVPAPCAWSWNQAAWALGASVIYAISDELHQAMVATRMASAWDVLLDSIGTALGLLYAFGLERRRARKLRSTH